MHTIKKQNKKKKKKKKIDSESMKLVASALVSSF